jgi:hypothetical protein
LVKELIDGHDSSSDNPCMWSYFGSMGEIEWNSVRFLPVQ